MRTCIPGEIDGATGHTVDTYLVFATCTTDFSWEGCTAGSDLSTLVLTLSSVDETDSEVRKSDVWILD